MDLRNLLNQNENNPYISWPGYTKDKFIINKNEQIFEDGKTEERFIYDSYSFLSCYFHVKDLEWDSLHYNFKCAQIKHFYINESLTRYEIERLTNIVKKDLFNYLKKFSYKFVYIDINSESVLSNYFIQKLGFTFIVNWMDGFYVTNPFMSINISESVLIRSDEVEEIANIAKHYYYKGGRFYTDVNFDRNLVDKMYYSIVKSSYNSNDIIIVARIENQPVGAFISKPICSYSHYNSLKVAHLRFLVIDKKCRGNNIGYNLFSSTINYFNDKCDIIVTGLESHNHISLNLHNKFKFKYNYSHNAYHLWMK